MLLNLVCEHFVEVLASIFIRAIGQKLSFLGMCLSEFGIRVILATRPFQYDLNQIPYYYTVDVTNKFKGLDLIECLKNYGRKFMTLYRRQGSRPSPRKRNARGQNGCLRRLYK